jgi:hypothetical protein
LNCSRRKSLRNNSDGESGRRDFSLFLSLFAVLFSLLSSFDGVVIVVVVAAVEEWRRFVLCGWLIVRK